MNRSPTYIPLASSELGSLWMAYQEKTLVIQLIRHLLVCAEDEESRNLLTGCQARDQNFANRIRELLTREGMAVPIGFGDEDLNAAAPPLFNGLLEISIFRMISKISMGLYALHLGMSYHEDIRKLNEAMSISAQDAYSAATDLLLRRGAISRPPIVTPPSEVEFVQELGYMKGQGIWKKARPINLVEAAHMYQQMETNATGLELMTGFAQTAVDEEARQYFVKGRDLARETIDLLGGILKESDIEPSAAPGGRTTDSTTPVFSDKMMMYLTNLLSSFGLGGNAMGTSFSLRSDLPLKLGVLATKVFQFAQEGGKLMIRHKWMEEPPQAENRNTLIGV